MPDGGEEFVSVVWRHSGGPAALPHGALRHRHTRQGSGREKEEEANAAKAAAEEALKNAKSELDLAKAQSELAVMAAQIAALRKFRQKK